MLNVVSSFSTRCMLDRFLLLLIVAFSLQPLFGQQPVLQLFTAQDGLANNRCTNVTQDSRGFIWFLSSNKLHRYDGRDILLFPMPRADQPAAPGRLLALEVYADSLLFLMGEKHVFLLDPHADEWNSFPLPLDSDGFYLPYTLEKAGPKDLRFTIQSRRDPSAEFYRFRDGALERLPVELKGPTDTTALTLGYDHRDDLYFVTADKVHVQTAGGSRRVIPTLLPETARSIKTSRVRGSEREQTVFEVNEKWLATLASNRDTLRAHPINKHLTAKLKYEFLGSANGYIWGIAYDDEDRLFFYDVAADRFRDYAAELRDILPFRLNMKGIFQDNTGIIWVTSQFGLLKVNPQARLFDTYLAEALPECDGFCSVRGITGDGDGKVYASYYRGLVRIDPRKKEVEDMRYNYPGPFGLASQGDFLLLNNGQRVTTSGFTHGGEVAGANASQRDIQFGVFAGRQPGSLYWAVRHLLHRLDTSAAEWRWEEVATLGSEVVDALHHGRYSDRVWISQGGRLLAWDHARDRVDTLPLAATQPSLANIFAIEEDARGNLWLATDVGLLHYDPARRSVLRHYTRQHGLRNTYLCGMLTEGDSCLWLSTNSGLSRFRIHEEDFTNFDEEDGLSHYEFNRTSYYQAADGRLFFGGLKGINAFYPREVVAAYQRGNENASLVLSSLEWADERSDTTFTRVGFSRQPTIAWQHYDQSFTFQYALTDYRHPADIYYSYRMEGWEEGWSSPSNFNFTRFSSLPSGDYTFRVRAQDSRGVWHGDELKIALTVHPAWWASWWAKTLYLVLAALVLLGIISFREKRWRLQRQLAAEHEEAQRLLELDNLKTRFFTNITHEFRTPLTVMLGTTEEIGRRQTEDWMNLPLALIRRNGQQLLSLINRVLDLAKLESQTLKPEYIRGDVIPYIRYIADGLAGLANTHNILLRVDSSRGALEMDYDPERLQQILHNLLSNAIKYTASGGTIAVRLTSEPGSSGPGSDAELVISVTDTGSGIPAHDLPHVFDRFYQVDRGDHQDRGGTGIGLALTRELVHTLGGRISVSSEVGVGSRFTVVLPILRTAQPVDYAVREKLPRFAAPDRSTREGADAAEPTIDLLLIEDNPDVVAYLTLCLKDTYRIDFAYNGRSGAERALETIPDIVISDVMMPEMDGLAVTEALKAAEQTSHIPIVLLTAKADLGSRLAGLRRGADAYLAKPFHRDELLATLDNLLASRRQLQLRFRAGLEQRSAPPDSAAPPGSVSLAVEDAFLRRVRAVIEEHLADSTFTIPELSHRVGVSQSQLYRKIKALTDLSTASFVRTVRLRNAVRMLETTDLNVSEVAYAVGFSSPSYFSDSFFKEYGTRPSDWRS